MERDNLLEDIKRRLATAPLVRREKIEGIERRLREGSYQIDTAAVARSLLKECILAEVLVSA